MGAPGTWIASAVSSKSSRDRSRAECLPTGIYAGRGIGALEGSLLLFGPLKKVPSKRHQSLSGSDSTGLGKCDALPGDPGLTAGPVHCAARLTNRRIRLWSARGTGGDPRSPHGLLEPLLPRLCRDPLRWRWLGDAGRTGFRRLEAFRTRLREGGWE